MKNALCLQELLTSFIFHLSIVHFATGRTWKGNQFKVTCDPLLSCNLFPSFAVNTPSDFDLLFSNGAHYLNHFHLAF